MRRSSCLIAPEIHVSGTRLLNPEPPALSKPPSHVSYVQVSYVLAVLAAVKQRRRSAR